MANISVHETKTTVSSSALSFSMEGSTSNNTEGMPFTWAPGWNSNQSISQFQDNVGEHLIDEKEHQFIEFLTTNTDEKSCDSDNQQADKQSTISLQVPWYRGDWQASLTPEFTLMKNANSLFISTKRMSENGWQQGQWLALELTLANQVDGSTSSSLTTIAQVNLDERISDEHIYGDIDLPLGCLIEKYSLQVATDEQKQDYQDKFNQRQQQALDVKEQTLVRLKAQDQMIPIRLVAGGLDDV